jgi:hypothetical protein
MGWTFMPKPYEGTSEWFKGQLTWTSENGATSRPLATAIVANSEAYAAVETIHADGRREVWAAAFMLKSDPKDPDGCTFGYKDMDETVGPYIDRCPARILDLLTPTESNYANEWRARCRARLARLARNKVSDGEIIQFDTALSFGRYGAADTFRVTMDGRKVHFWALDTDTHQRRFLCRITNWSEREFKRVEPVQASEPPRQGM